VSELSTGAYEHVVTDELARRIASVPDDLVQRGPLDPAEAHDHLADYLATVSRRALRAVSGDGAARLAAQVAVVNRMLAELANLVPGAVLPTDQVARSHDLLWAVATRPPSPEVVAFPRRPSTGFATGALLVNGRGQPHIGHEVAAEMASADSVDLLCAFIKLQGVRLIEDAVRDLIARGGRMRLITTTYIGATDQRAVDRLARLGVVVKVSYEARTTRLHAKAWRFQRAAGTSTAYVGSSNLSRSAMVDGLEWNVRVSGLEQPYVLETFAAMFDQYWEDPAFEAYEPDRDGERLRTALARERESTPADLGLEITNLDVRPYPYQQLILEELAARREVHGEWRNLVVMATGTGKTIVAAIDYRQLRAAGTVNSLLFVAHQEHILTQSRSMFRHVLRDGSFGELLVGGDRPTDWKHVFASVQSLNRKTLDDLDAERFDMVIVDEFHHSEAPTYARLIAHLTPKVFVGLTATPERADGQDILHWFGGRPSVELRVWEALERQLLAPFQYFGIHDDVDLSHLQWKRGPGYQTAELSNVYTGNDARAQIVMEALRDKADVQTMQAIGFCVSIDHAEFMARFFDTRGVPARAVTSRDDRASRREAMSMLANGSLRILFTVDLFNEGVDLPRVDTILLLRPTQSATIFLQQLGRGLRQADGKAYLTVLDFIGAQHAEFRFDLRYRALTGTSRRALTREADADFPTLPPGCHISLDRVSKQVVLANLKRSLSLRPRDLAGELARLGPVSLVDFLADTGLEVEDIYRSPTLGGWSGLHRLAGLSDADPVEKLSRAIGRMLHIDDPARIAQLKHVAGGGSPSGGRLADMLRLSLWGAKGNDRLADLHASEASCHELREVAEVLQERIHRVTRPLQAVPAVPLWLHARYSRDEACGAFGIADPSAIVSGVRWVESEKADLFFVTLSKTERRYSPTTMYADRAVTPEIFQWESQNTTREGSATGQRYVNHVAAGSTVHLFLRETKERDGALGAPPYLYAGTMRYVSHEGERPMRIRWRLDQPLPADVYHSAQVAAG
jgi:superfamily II DNA or RNA helicase/HKD family nuclease